MAMPLLTWQILRSTQGLIWNPWLNADILKGFCCQCTFIAKSVPALDVSLIVFRTVFYILTFPLIPWADFPQPSKTFLNSSSVVTAKLKCHLIFCVIGSWSGECSHACLTQADCWKGWMVGENRKGRDLSSWPLVTCKASSADLSLDELWQFKTYTHKRGCDEEVMLNSRYTSAINTFLNQKQRDLTDCTGRGLSKQTDCSLLPTP